MLAPDCPSLLSLHSLPGIYRAEVPSPIAGGEHGAAQDRRPPPYQTMPREAANSVGAPLYSSNI
jgi:hypothetical protein